MFLRFLSLVAFLGAAHAVSENPCKDKVLKCDDAIQGASCQLVFPTVGADPNPKCFDPTDGDFAMTSLCRSTCGLCCQEPEYDCDDNPIPGIDCPGEPETCNQFSDINFEHCQSSCGWCKLTSKPCVDMIDSVNCLQFKDALLCDNAEVKAQCEKTCGYCQSADCEDASKRCPTWVKNGFCQDEFYKDDKAVYCKKSCGLCP